MILKLSKADYSAPEILASDLMPARVLCGSFNGETEQFDIEDYEF